MARSYVSQEAFLTTTLSDLEVLAGWGPHLPPPHTPSNRTGATLQSQSASWHLQENIFLTAVTTE